MIELHVDLEAVQKRISYLGHVLPSVIKKAINAASRDALRHLGRLIKADPSFPDIRKPNVRLKLKGNRLWIGLNPVDALNFKEYTLQPGEFAVSHGGKTKTKRKSTLGRSGGSQNVTIKGGSKRYKGVYKRKGNARLPIIRIKGDVENAALIAIYNHVDTAESWFMKRFEHHLNYYSGVLT